MTVQFPNVVLILADNHPAELLGCYGNYEIHTPNLDRLAQQGVQFNNAFSVNAMCSPCRAAILTGLMPSQHGIHTWLDDRVMHRWPPHWNAIAELATLPEILAEHGYKTALIGKYHLGVPDAPQNGFEHWVTFPLGHTLSFWNNTIIDNGEQYPYPGHIVDCFTGKAVEYIRAHDSDSDPPFFLYLPYNAPYGHWPAIRGAARNRFAALYADTEMKTVPREGLSKAAIERSFMRQQESGGGIDYSAHLQLPNNLTSLRNYFSQMSMVDDGVGKVLTALERKGLDENTLVIYSCDHGFSLGHNGFWGHGQATWPANAHKAAYSIPLLVRHANHIEPRQVVNRMVSQIDLFATILEYLGLGDAEANDNSPSRNFAPLLKGQVMNWDADEIFLEQEEVRAVRTREWLFVQRFKGGVGRVFRDELYDLVRDPLEQNDLILEADYQDVARALRDRVETFFREHAVPRYDLWNGGATKSNSDKPALWESAWGVDWAPVFD